MLWYVNYKCASFWRRKKKEEKKEGEEEAEEEEEGRGCWKRRGGDTREDKCGEVAGCRRTSPPQPGGSDVRLVKWTRHKMCHRHTSWVTRGPKVNGMH